MSNITLRIGDELCGYCAGFFGRSYLNKRVEAIGKDWVVARDTEGTVWFGEGCPEELCEFLYRLRGSSENDDW